MRPRTPRATRTKKPAPQTFTPLPEPDAGAGIPESPRAPNPDPDRRRAMVAEAAYYRAEQRGFAPGYELEDWFAAEDDVDLKEPSIGPTPCGPGL